MPGKQDKHEKALANVDRSSECTCKLYNTDMEADDLSKLCLKLLSSKQIIVR